MLFELLIIHCNFHLISRVQSGLVVKALFLCAEGLGFNSREKLFFSFYFHHTCDRMLCDNFGLSVAVCVCLVCLVINIYRKVLDFVMEVCALGVPSSCLFFWLQVLLALPTHKR